jgi:hypothetical protein
MFERRRDKAKLKFTQKRFDRNWVILVYSVYSVCSVCSVQIVLTVLRVQCEEPRAEGRILPKSGMTGIG